MASILIEMPDELARSLEGLAAAEHKTLQELAIERLRAFVLSAPPPALTPAQTILKILRDTPRPSQEAMDDLDAAIEFGRLPVNYSDPFSN